MSTSRTSDPGRVRASWTVLVTLVIIGLELLLLAWVYERAAPVRDERVAVAQVVGRYAEPPGAVTSATDVGAALRGAGVPAADTGQVVSALSGGSPVTYARAESQLIRLASAVRARQRALDDQAIGIYAALLVAVSVGWALWFRRLVARHRALQAQLTGQEAQRHGERRMAALLRNATDLTLVCDTDLAIVSATPAARRLIGEPPETLLGRHVAQIVHPDHAEVLYSLILAGRFDTTAETPVRLEHVDGDEVWAELTLNDLRDDPDVGGMVVTVRDVTARRTLERRLSHDALHDSLTGLGNRRLFLDRLEHALARGHARQAHQVLFLDLDDFKGVNDALGHEIGDVLLTEVAQRLYSALRVSDTLARLGGDEFAVLLEETSQAEAEALARRVLDALRAPLTLPSGSSVGPRVSIGIAEARGGECDSGTVLRNADVAMYAAKKNGGSRFAQYEARMHAQQLDRRQLRSELESAVEAAQLVLHYQPVTSLADGRVASFEALVRWEHPVRGMVPPADFIPMAEETGLVVPIGSWVLHEAAREMVSLDPSAAGPGVAVNVAAAQVVPELVAEVAGVLADTGLAPGRLCLELTETSFLRDVDHVRAILTAVRDLGVRVAVDDFGTGFSSLSYLANLPVDVLKLDKAFVDRVTDGGREAQLAEAIIALGHNLGLSTTAEGVEDAAQAEWLRRAGCVHGQGFLWSKPVPLAQARDLVDQRPTGCAVPPPRAVLTAAG